MFRLCIMLNDGRITCTRSLSLANHVQTHTHAQDTTSSVRKPLWASASWSTSSCGCRSHITSHLQHHELELPTHLHMGLGRQPLTHTDANPCARSHSAAASLAFLLSSFFLDTRPVWCLCKRVRKRLHIRCTAASSRSTQTRAQQTERNG